MDLTDQCTDSIGRSNVDICLAGVSLEKLDNTFIEMIKASVDKPLPITVYNYKSMTKR